MACMNSYDFHIKRECMKIMRATFPCVPWHATSVYDGHLRGPVAFTSIAERLCIAFVTTCVYELSSVAAGF